MHQQNNDIVCQGVIVLLMDTLEMPVPSQGHYGFHSFPVVQMYAALMF
jgi:hypothetical protein